MRVLHHPRNLAAPRWVTTRAASPSAVKTGMIEMSRAAGSYYKGFIPEGDVEAGIPLMWRSLHDVMVIIWDKGMGDILKEAYAEHNTVWLAIGASAATFHMMSSRPLSGAYPHGGPTRLAPMTSAVP